MNGIFPLLIIGRLIDGFTGGNTSVAMSSIADISDKKSKAGNFGIMGMAMGMGFVLGPFIGGKLGDSSVVSWFNYSTPFLFAVSIFEPICGLEIDKINNEIAINIM